MPHLVLRPYADAPARYTTPLTCARISCEEHLGDYRFTEFAWTAEADFLPADWREGWCPGRDSNPHGVTR